ncbi:MAG TPA: hypothetical protein VN898_15770 [Candidatus Binatia bacterium]|nr:hypothetical protein [Candidatus Binatia bacterium]
MRHVLASVVVLGFAILISSPCAYADGDVNFGFGSRAMDDEDSWEPTEDQDVFGVTADFGARTWPLHMAVGYYSSSDEGQLANFPVLGPVDLDSEVSEMSLGVHKVWTVKNARPFLGGGVTFVDAEADVESVLGQADDDESSTGAYLEGGIFWRLGEAFNLGLQGRFVQGTDITLFDVEGDADYFQIGALIGFGWK